MVSMASFLPLKLISQESLDQLKANVDRFPPDEIEQVLKRSLSEDWVEGVNVILRSPSGYMAHLMKFCLFPTFVQPLARMHHRHPKEGLLDAIMDGMFEDPCPFHVSNVFSQCITALISVYREHDVVEEMLFHPRWERAFSEFDVSRCRSSALVSWLSGLDWSGAFSPINQKAVEKKRQKLIQTLTPTEAIDVFLHCNEWAAHHRASSFDQTEKVPLPVWDGWFLDLLSQKPDAWWQKLYETYSSSSMKQVRDQTVVHLEGWSEAMEKQRLLKELRSSEESFEWKLGLKRKM